MTPAAIPDQLPPLPADLFSTLPAVEDNFKGVRIKDIADGRSEAFRIDPLKIRPEPGFNGRRRFEGIPELADDMLHNGQSDPITVRRDADGHLLLVTGERRWRAGVYLRRVLGHEWTLKCQLEAPNTKPIDRLFRQLSENSGKEFSLLEKAYLYDRILNEEPRLTEAELSRRSQTTRQAVNQALTLVRFGAPDLLCMVEQELLSASLAGKIITRYKEDPTAQVAAAREAVDKAKREGKDHASPKHLESEDLRWDLTPGDVTRKDHGAFTTPTTFTLRGVPAAWPLADLRLMLVHYDGRWHDNFDIDAGGCLTEGLPNLTAYLDPSPDSEPEAWMTVFFSAWRKLLGSGKLKERQLKAIEESWHAALRERFPTYRPDDSAPFSDDADTDDETEDDHTTPAHDDEQPGLFNDDDDDADAAPARTPSFDLFRFTGRPVPKNPDAFPNGTEPEEYRAVLLDIPDDWGIQSMHVLFTFRTEETDGDRHANFGHRITTADGEEHCRLPERSAWSWSELDFEKHAVALGHLAREFSLPTDADELLTDAWTDAVARYFGLNPEPPTDMQWLSPADKGATDRIKSTRDTNRDGSNVGPGSNGGFVKPDKRLEQFEKLLEGISADSHDEERMQTAELISSYMNNTADGSALRQHLRGE